METNILTGDGNWHSVLGSSFADATDLAAWKRCKAQGKSDTECFKVGDNCIGCYGDFTGVGAPPMCALPPEDSEAKWGSVGAAKHKPMNVTYQGKTVQCILGDRMPHKANITNNAGIDLNPAACTALGLTPPVMARVEWEWA